MPPISTASKIVAFVMNFFYQMTVQLAVEFTKIITMLLILSATFSVMALGCVSLLLWTYGAYEGSLGAMSCAAVLAAVLFVLGAYAVEHLLVNVLCLTDMPLAQLLKLCLGGVCQRKQTKRL